MNAAMAFDVLMQGGSQPTFSRSGLSEQLPKIGTFCRLAFLRYLVGQRQRRANAKKFKRTGNPSPAPSTFANFGC